MKKAIQFYAWMECVCEKKDFMENKFIIVFGGIKRTGTIEEIYKIFLTEYLK